MADERWRAEAERIAFDYADGLTKPLEDAILRLIERVESETREDYEGIIRGLQDALAGRVTSLEDIRAGAAAASPSGEPKD